MKGLKIIFMRKVIYWLKWCSRIESQFTAWPVWPDWFFFKVLDGKFSCKVDQICGNTSRAFFKTVTFGSFLIKIGLLFIAKSGHTGLMSYCKKVLWRWSLKSSKEGSKGLYGVVPELPDERLDMGHMFDDEKESFSTVGRFSVFCFVILDDKQPFLFNVYETS